MPISNNIDGVWRELWSASAKVNGVWRDTDVWSNIDGVWRPNFRHDIDETEIFGFRVVYKYVESIKHPSHPGLIVNRSLPFELKLTGEHIGIMDTSKKGILFQYDNDPYEQEGIVAYKGDLYALLTSGQIINVGMCTSEVGADSRVPGNIPGIAESWSTNKLSNLSIQLDASVLYESTGYYMNGWNSLFSTEQFLDRSNYPDKGPHKNKLELNSYDILPTEKRLPTYDSAAYIGIARDMTSETNNMIGSFGLLDQTILEIRVNGVIKPFTVEFYN